MMGRVAVIYDLEIKTMLSTSTIAQLGVEFSGKALARSFLNLIPGVGNAINASVAGALTAASGEGWVRLCESIHLGKIEPGNMQEKIEDFSPTVVAVMRHLFENKLLRRRD